MRQRQNTGNNAAAEHNPAAWCGSLVHKMKGSVEGARGREKGRERERERSDKDCGSGRTYRCCIYHSCARPVVAAAADKPTVFVDLPQATAAREVIVQHTNEPERVRQRMPFFHVYVTESVRVGGVQACARVYACVCRSGRRSTAGPHGMHEERNTLE